MSASVACTSVKPGMRCLAFARLLMLSRMEASRVHGSSTGQERRLSIQVRGTGLVHDGAGVHGRHRLAPALLLRRCRLCPSIVNIGEGHSLH